MWSGEEGGPSGSQAGGSHAALAADAVLDLPEFSSPPADPVALLAEWIAQAQARGVREPLALTLATVSARQDVSARVVLVKELAEGGLVFTSHVGSRKGQDLAAVPRAAGSLYWRETLQQVNVAGPVERLSAAESDRLFADRPVAAQATTVVSAQSRPLRSTDDLATRAAAIVAVAAAGSGADGGGGTGADTGVSGPPITRPEGWLGYRLVLERIEFWHGSPDRLHRRLHYERGADGAWAAQRLQP